MTHEQKGFFYCINTARHCLSMLFSIQNAPCIGPSIKIISDFQASTDLLLNSSAFIFRDNEVEGEEACSSMALSHWCLKSKCSNTTHQPQFIKLPSNNEKQNQNDVPQNILK